jgi:hypothetical protein
MHFHHFWHGFVLGFGLIAASAVQVFPILRACRKPPSGDAK